MSVPRGSRGRPQLIALGAWLAARGALAAVGWIFALFCALGAVGFAVFLRGPEAARLPTLAALVVAWSAGVTLAFGSALGAVSRDWRDGVLALARARGVGAASYMTGRTLGLSFVIALAVGGPTLVASLAAVAVSDSPLLALRDSASAIAYAAAFAATLGPLAMAAVGIRGRAPGYVVFLLVLVVPELAESYTASLLPSGWHELTSLPAALAAVAAGVVAPASAGLRALRAAAALAAVAIVSLVVANAGVARLGRAERIRRGEGA